MYKINKSIVLNESTVSASKAYSSSPRNIEYTKESQEKAASREQPEQQSVYDLAKVVSSQKEYQKVLWDPLSTGNAQSSLFTAVRSAWTSRKDHITP